MDTITNQNRTTTATTNLTIPTRGPFSLAESELVGFGHRDASSFDGVTRLAFTLDGDHEHAAGVEVRQEGERLRLTVTTAGDADVAARQVARILSVDVDGEGFVELGRRDRMVGALQQAAPGLRPPQFYSPYEAAAWSILSARRSRFQGIAVRDRLNQAYGEPFELAGQRVHAFPAPSRLLTVEHVPGLPSLAIPRLHEVARAAMRGELDVARLTQMSPDRAMESVQRLPGIGPFYSALIVARGAGLADVLPLNEPRSRSMIERLRGTGPLSDAEFEAIAADWSPYRMWVLFLSRAAGGRLLDPSSAPVTPELSTCS